MHARVLHIRVSAAELDLRACILQIKFCAAELDLHARVLHINVYADELDLHSLVLHIRVCAAGLPPKKTKIKNDKGMNMFSLFIVFPDMLIFK